MSTALPGLVVDIEARIDKLEKGMRRANRVQGQAAREMEQRADRSAKRIRNSYEQATNGISASFARMARSFGGGLIGGIVGGVGVAAFASNARRAISEMSNLAKVADRVGIAVEDLQGLQRGFELAGVESDTLNRSLEVFGRNVGEATRGTGPLVKILNDYGVSLTKADGSLKNQRELLRDVANLIRNTKDEALQLAIAQAAFGEGGVGMVNALRSGAEGIDGMISSAREAGRVIDEQMIRQAEILDDQFAELANSADVFFKRVVIGGAEILGMVTSLDGIFGSMDRARQILPPEAFEMLEKNVALVNDVSPLLERISESYRFLESMPAVVADAAQDAKVDLDLFAQGLERVGELATVDVFRGMIAELEELQDKFHAGEVSGDDFLKQAGEIQSRLQGLVEKMQSVNAIGYDGAIERLQNLGGAISLARTAAEGLAAALAEGAGFWASEVPPAEEFGPPMPPPSTIAPKTSPRPQRPGIDFGLAAARRGGSGGGAREDEFERALKAVRDQTMALELEAAALLASVAAGHEYAGAIEAARKEAELLLAAQRAGRELTPELRAQVSALAQGYSAQADATRKVTEEQQRLNAAQEEVRSAASNAFVGLITGALEFRDALSQVIAQLAQMAAARAFQMIWEGAGAGGPVAGIMKMFGFAEGGYTGPGGTYQPAGLVHKGEYVMSKAATDRIGVANLEALHQGALRGYSGGGLVGRAAPIPAGPARAGGDDGQSISISAPITVNGSAGTPQQNDDLAKKMAREMELTLRGVVIDEMRRQMRPGNLGNQRVRN